MKKSISILSMLAACSAFAGEVNLAPAETALQLPAEEKNAYTLTIQAGIMHTGVDNATLSSSFAALAPDVAHDTNLQIVPSILYGVSVGVEKNLTEPGTSRFFHTVGASVGFYTGSEDNQLYSIADAMVQLSTLACDSDVSVNMIPVMLTYNVQYEATESLYFYAGVRGGVVIRKTDVDASVSWKISSNQLPAPVNICEEYDDSSTKVLPTVGLGVGMRAYMTDNLAFDLSYDLNWSFGDDCDDIEGSMGTVLPGTTESSRYFGTVKAGFSYSF